MSTADRLGTQHIGAAGELLIQYRLLKLGIDSARLTTDSGVDLIAYSPFDGSATTIQVKSVLKPTPAGGRGKDHVVWGFRHALGTQLLALVRLDTDQVWLFTLAEAHRLAQQNSGGERKLYWYIEQTAEDNRPGTQLQQHDMNGYALEKRVPALFLGHVSSSSGGS